MRILISNQQKKIRINLARVKKLVRSVLKKLNEKNSEISIAFVDNLKIKKLNKKYLKRNYPTDVIAFAFREDKSLVKEDMLGDVIISLETVKENSLKLNVKFEEEKKRVIIHGILHLIGFDHVRKKDASEMLPLQEKLLTEFTKCKI